MALTDHDTTAGWERAAAALPAGVALVPGVELSCTSAGTSLHLLAYLFDPLEPVFAAARASLRESRVGRAREMVGLLEDAGTGMTWERVAALADGTVGRPHVARALVELGHVPDVAAAFDPAWIGTGGRFWVGRHEQDVLDAVAMVTRAGGVAVFAHPAASTRGRTVGDDVVAAMAAAGLAGLEVDHVDHDDAGRAHLRGLAADLGLLVTGSSDYHGTSKPVRLGAHTTAPAAYEELVARATGGHVLRA